MRPLCPAPVNCSVRVLDHRLVAPEVPALQHRLLAPVDKLPHLPELVPGGLLLLHDDGDVLPPPDDRWATRKGTFFVVASVPLTRMARGSRHTTFPEPFLVPTLAATRHWRCLPPGLKLPCQPTWNRFSSRQNTSQADVSVKSGPDHQWPLVTLTLAPSLLMSPRLLSGLQMGRLPVPGLQMRRPPVHGLQMAATYS